MGECCGHEIHSRLFVAFGEYTELGCFDDKGEFYCMGDFFGCEVYENENISEQLLAMAQGLA